MGVFAWWMSLQVAHVRVARAITWLESIGRLSQATEALPNGRVVSFLFKNKNGGTVVPCVLLHFVAFCCTEKVSRRRGNTAQDTE